METFKSIGLRVSSAVLAAFENLAASAGKAGEEAKFFADALAKSALKQRAPAGATPSIKRYCGWLDNVGMPHGRSGDKLVRKTVQGTVGLTHARGPYAVLLTGRLSGSTRRRHERAMKRMRG